MSYGKLCGAKIKISKSINSENTIEISCGLYEGHIGKHSKTFYHCKDKKDCHVQKHNHFLGSIVWSDTLKDQ